MPDIFDKISATNNGAPSGDIFDRISESKGGEQTNAQNQPQANQDRYAGREAFNEVNASSSNGSQSGKEQGLRNQQVPQRYVNPSEPSAQKSDEALLKGDIFDRIAKGGDNIEKNAKAESQRTQEGQEDGQGVRGQDDARKQEEVGAGGVRSSSQPSRTLAGLGSFAEGAIDFLGGLGTAAIGFPAAAAIGIPTAGIGGIATEAALFTAGSYGTRKARESLERSLGIKKTIEESQQAYPEYATAGQILPMVGMGAAGLTKLGQQAITKGVGEAAKTFGAGVATGVAFEPIRYGVETVLKHITGDQGEVDPITGKSVLLSGLIGGAAHGLGIAKLEEAGLPETAKAAAILDAKQATSEILKNAAKDPNQEAHDAFEEAKSHIENNDAQSATEALNKGKDIISQEEGTDSDVAKNRQVLITHLEDQIKNLEPKTEATTEAATTKSSEAETEVEGGTTPGKREGEAEQVTPAKPDWFVEEPTGTRIEAAAYRDPKTGIVHEAEDHQTAESNSGKSPEPTEEGRETENHGFTTDKGEFVTREKAQEIAEKSGQFLGKKTDRPVMHSNEVDLDIAKKPEVPFEQLSEGHKLFSEGLDRLVKGGSLDDARKSVIKKIFRNTDPELLARASDMKSKKTGYLGAVRWVEKYSEEKGKFGKSPEFRLKEGLVDLLKEKDPKINKEATATFLHEFGHLADYVFLNDAEKATIKDVYNKLKRLGRREFFGKGLASESEFYTNYYASNEAEFFAQSFAEYCLSERVPTEEMRPILERAFDFFKEAIARILKRATTNEAKLLKPIFERIISGKMEPKELESSFIPKKGDLKTQKEMMNGGFVSPEKVTATPSRDPLEELSEKIKKSSTAKPPKNAFDAAKQAQKIVEEVKGAKDAVTKGIAKAGAGFQAMKNSYLNRPVWTDFKQALGEWSRADNYTSLKVREAVKDLKKSIPDPLKREAITNWIQAGGDEALLRERASKSDSKYRKGYEAALKLTDEEKAHAKNISKYLEDMLQEGIDSGMLNHGIENYITQVWKKENPVTQKLQASLQGGKLNKNFQFAKKRVFDSYFEGEQAGYEPASKDVASLIAAYDLSFRKTEAVRAFVKSMTEGKAQDGKPLVELSGYAQPVGEEGKPPDSYLIKPTARPEGAVTADGRPYVSINHPAFKGWKWTMAGPDGKPVLMESDMLVHPDIATEIKNLTSKSWFKANRIPVVSSAVEGLLKFSSILKQTKLSLSLFHLDQEGLHSLFHRINPANLEKIDLNDEKQNQLVLHGLQLADFHSQELFSEGLAGGGLVGKIPVIGKAQNWFNDFLFKDYIPKLKMNMATHALERNMARYGKQLSEDQIYELTAYQANAAFGELNYKMMARNQTVQDTLRLFLLAPDFLEARSRFVAQALKPYGAEQRAALALMGASLYVAGRVLNQALDGDPHYDKPFSIFHEGREYRLRTVLGDVSELVDKPNTFFMNRLSPFGRTGVEFLTGRNAQGIKRSAVEQAEDFLSWFVPIPAQVQPSSTTASTILSSIGLSNYQHMAQTDAYDLANKWLKNQTSPKIQAQVKKREEATLAESDYKQLKAALLAGNMDFAKKEYNRLVKEKGKTYLDFSRSFNVNKPFTGSFENEVKFYKSLNANEKAQYKKAIEERKVIAQRLRKTITK